MIALVVLIQIAATAVDSAPPLAPPFALDTVRHRVRAIEISDAYNKRLRIHKYASYATIPLFVAEYFTGDRLYSDAAAGIRSSGFARSFHAPIAVAIGGLFGVNTVTGVWNFWEGRKAPAGRTRRIIHSALMIASDAGFVATAISAGGAKQSSRVGVTTGDASGRNLHRTLAITSGSLSLVGYLMMLIWKG